MRFELGLPAPDPSRAQRDAVTVAASYIVGGLIPPSKQRGNRVQQAARAAGPCGYRGSRLSGWYRGDDIGALLNAGCEDCVVVRLNPATDGWREVLLDIVPGIFGQLDFGAPHGCEFAIQGTDAREDFVSYRVRYVLAAGRHERRIVEA